MTFQPYNSTEIVQRSDTITVYWNETIFSEHIL